ncbi:MAG: putative tellurium resistance membrane protein TerC [Parvicellaceae bacterium]|jgi:predicted tellurium resistance membrane protein TerC
MADLFTWANVGTLLMLVMLQIVLGFDNLLYISLESKRAPEEKQGFVRTVGISIAILLRILLLFVLKAVESYFHISVFSISFPGVFEVSLTIESLIYLIGGIFIIYTAIKEIWHMISYQDSKEKSSVKKQKKIGPIITMIVIMNVVFSFDSILSATALCDNYTVMATAIVIGGILMIVLSGAVSRFLAKNKLYEVLGLFILLIVGIMLLTDGGHLGGMKIAGDEVTKMTKTTFYFVIVVLVLVDIVQGRYQKNLIKKNAEKEQLLDAPDTE